MSLRCFYFPNPNSGPFHFLHLILPLFLALDGPDKPVLKVSPTKAVFVSGESLFLSCQAEGEPAPSTSWFLNGESIATSGTGTVHLSNIKTSQSGVYTCMMVNARTKATLQRNLTVIIYGMSLQFTFNMGILACYDVVHVKVLSLDGLIFFQARKHTKYTL